MLGVAHQRGRAVASSVGAVRQDEMRDRAAFGPFDEQAHGRITPIRAGKELTDKHCGEGQRVASARLRRFFMWAARFAEGP